MNCNPGHCPDTSATEALTIVAMLIRGPELLVAHTNASSQLAMLRARLACYEESVAEALALKTESS